MKGVDFIMSTDWESIFTTWSKGPSATEEEKAENAEQMVRDAISASSKLSNRNIFVFTQGSYRNRVHVSKDSDVDIGVLCYDAFFPEYPDTNVKARINAVYGSSSYGYDIFKNEIEEALVAKFGRPSVKRSNKAFDIKENSYHVEADVVAFFEHRRYTSATNYLSGVEMIPDNGNPPMIRNWPEQHYKNGVSKNDNTSRKFKRVVRIIKCLSNQMTSENIAAANQVPSFLIECLIWNVSNEYFGYDNFCSIIRSVLAHLFNNTLTQEACSEWGEVSELKYLFKGSQPWTVKQSHDFISAAWDYIGYK